MGYDRSYNMEGIGMVYIKMSDGMVRILKEVRYVPQQKINLISISFLEELGLEVSSGDGVLKMIKGSMVVLTGT